jgi:hypothetical protein
MPRTWRITCTVAAAAVVLLGAAGCGDRAATGVPTTTEPDSKTEFDSATPASSNDFDAASYCSLMERTAAAYQNEELTPASLKALYEAENQRIAGAPSELQDEYVAFRDMVTGPPDDAIERIQDWTQEHCGFRAYFGDP